VKTSYRHLLVILGFVAGGTRTAFSETKILSMEEVQKHGTTNSCWMVIDGNVYDFTSILKEHKEMCQKLNLEEYCGKDATNVWKEKESSGNPHKKKSLLKFQKSLKGKINTKNS
jgi:cytochrome b involved in lipid metabolism